ncbi:MAG: 23S rRNA (guanosine(2251)-2'-O)-methyltransferase RlmB [Mariprofundaceae bacterium]
MNQIIAGIHAVRHALQERQPVYELVIEQGKVQSRLDELIQIAKTAGAHISFLPRPDLDRLSEGVVHQGVVARLRVKPAPSFDTWLNSLDMQSNPLVLLLDSITDPHNLGACLRSADAAGCCGVIIPSDRSASLSPVAAKVASGALARLPVVYVNNLVRAMKQMQKQGFFIYGLAGEGEASLFQTNLLGRTGLVLGSEDKGLRRLVRDTCDVLVHIPMSGNVESLNVSVATGVALFEAVRQRLD